jgi:hypothetical protein
MKRRNLIPRRIAFLALAIAAMCITPAAIAHIHIGIVVPGVTVGVGNCGRCGYRVPPVYYVPPPVYYGYGYYVPAPVYYGYRYYYAPLHPRAYRYPRHRRHRGYYRHRGYGRHRYQARPHGRYDRRPYR